MKKIVIIFFIIFISLLSSNLFSQTKIDSLKQVIKKLSIQKGYTADTTMFNLLLDIGKKYTNSSIDSSTCYYTKAKYLAIKITNDLYLAKAIFLIGLNNMNISNNEEAKNNFDQAVNLTKQFTKNSNKYIQSTALRLTAGSYGNLGQVFIAKGDYPHAIEMFFNALKIQELLHRKIDVAYSYNGIGSVYIALKKYETALKYLLKSLKISEELQNSAQLSKTLINIGNVYYEMGDNTKALDYYLKSKKNAEKTNDKESLTAALINIGSIYLKDRNYSKALEYMLSSLKIAREINDKISITINVGNICNVYIKQKKLNLAEEYAKKELELALELESLEDIKQAKEQLYIIYQQTNRHALALQNYKQYIIYRDSITNVENDKAIIQKELQYNYDKKATADSIVNAKAQEIKDAQLAKNKLEIKAKQNQQYALFGGLALVLVFAGFMYNRFKITQRQKVVIEEQKQLVDVSQKKTMDSINYAKKIQHSILPSSEQLGSIFPNHFIFFKPKDVVSGDFYWFHHQNNLSFIAVADCTGHGVPGAFMTMIGYSNLIEVVAQQKVIEPNKILENLHQHIFNNLQQNKGDAYSQDGMDISLAVIDHENSLLHFSAAYNHGYLIHNKHLQTLKATSKSIGGLSILGEVEPERNFKTETIPFTKGSLLILTTDGIFDQLNKRDEKFGNERFKELALKFNTENAQENLQLVEQTYNNWKQDLPQLDDLCLLGLVI